MPFAIPVIPPQPHHVFVHRFVFPFLSAFSYFLSLLSFTTSLQMGSERRRTLILNVSSPSPGESAWNGPSLLSWDYSANPMGLYQRLFLKSHSVDRGGSPRVSGWNKSTPLSEAGAGRQPGAGGWRAIPQGRAGEGNRWEKGNHVNTQRECSRFKCCQMIVYHLFIHLKPKLGDRSTIPCHDQSP